VNPYLSRIASYFRLKVADRRIRSSGRRGETNIPFGPSSLNLMMADTCNSQCVMCGKDYRACGTGRYLSLDNVRTIYRHLDMSRVVDVIYGGGGEPFLNPDLSRIAAYTRAHYPVIQHTVISNGIDFRKDVAETLLLNGVHFLLSVNAATSETYRRVSGVDGFEHVMDNVRALAAMCREPPSSLALSMILMRQNIEELPLFVELAATIGADAVKTLYARIYPPAFRAKDGREGMIMPQDSLFYHQKTSDSCIRKAKDTARRLGISLDHEPLFDDPRGARVRDCHEPWKSLFINFNGEVYPCPASEILFRPKIDQGRYKSGNILEQEVSAFWNNRFWQSLRRTNAEQDRQEIVPECLCCGNMINWAGPRCKQAHVLDWSIAEKSALEL